MIDEVMRQEQIPAAPLSVGLEKIREDTEFLNRRLRWSPSLGQDRGYIKIEFRYPQWV